MKQALFFLVAITAFVAAVFSPSDSKDGSGGFVFESDTKVLNAGAGQRKTDSDTSSNWIAGETVLERSGDGHFYADVEVNGSSVEVLVDTGASVVALTGADAEALGLDWDEADVREVGSGASGAVYGVPVMLERITLGGHEATNVEAVILPDGLGITLLGQSFLSTINPVRIEGDRMVLGG